VLFSRRPVSSHTVSTVQSATNLVTTQEQSFFMSLCERDRNTRRHCQLVTLNRSVSLTTAT